MEETAHNYYLSIPVLLSMAVNLLLLVNIVRVLVTKLRGVNAEADHHATRKVGDLVVYVEVSLVLLVSIVRMRVTITW